MKPTPYDHFTYEYEELKPLFTTVLEDPAFRSFDPEAHRAHLKSYQRDYSLFFHNSRREKWGKTFRSPKTERRMWHMRTDAYLAHLVQGELVHRETRDAYADTLDIIRHQHRHLGLLCQTLLSDVYRGPRPKQSSSLDRPPENILRFDTQDTSQGGLVKTSTPCTTH